ncbi:MAG: hypothetical protein AAF389_08950 [Gemmatimonadota bacterium]
MTNRSTLWVKTVTALTLGALAGCGSLTAGGIGEAVVIVSAEDDANPAFSAPAGAWGAGLAGFVDGPMKDDHDDDDPEGELELEMFASLVAADGTVEPLTNGVLEIEIDLEGVEQDESLPRTIPAAPYTELRLTFVSIEAEVDAGLVVNGVPFTGPVEVEIEDPLDVTRSLDLELPDEGRAEIFIDLNVTQWLQALDPVAGTVDPQVFAQLIDVRVR